MASPDDLGQAQRSDGPGAVAALLTGGDPRSLRNAAIVIDAASRQPERLEELVQCVFSADEIVRMRASDALEKVCRSHPGLVQRFVPRLLSQMSRIGQPSVQWAQILTEVQLDEAEQAEAIVILERNLDSCGDWIVTNVTLQALAVFARTSAPVRARLVERLHHYQHSPYKSVASRARKLLAEFDGKPAAPHHRHGPRPSQHPEQPDRARHDRPDRRQDRRS